MTRPTPTSNSRIRPISASELRAFTTGGLSLPSDFWEGPGENLENRPITFLGAFPPGEDGRLLGFIGIRDVTQGEMTPETSTALLELLTRKRREAKIGAISLARLEADSTEGSDVVARNIGFASVADRGKGTGTLLCRAAMALAARDASPEQPMPAYLSVAAPNPSIRLFTRLGFEALFRADGAPYTRDYEYYLPASEAGEFAPPTMEPHQLMGIILTGEETS